MDPTMMQVAIPDSQMGMVDVASLAAEAQQELTDTETEICQNCINGMRKPAYDKPMM